MGLIPSKLILWPSENFVQRHGKRRVMIHRATHGFLLPIFSSVNRNRIIFELLFVHRLHLEPFFRDSCAAYIGLMTPMGCGDLHSKSRGRPRSRVLCSTCRGQLTQTGFCPIGTAEELTTNSVTVGETKLQVLSTQMSSLQLRW